MIRLVVMSTEHEPGGPEAAGDTFLWGEGRLWLSCTNGCCALSAQEFRRKALPADWRYATSREVAEGAEALYQSQAEATQIDTAEVPTGPLH